VVTAV